MGGLYNSLNFPSSMQGNVTEYDDKTKKHMDNVKIISNDDDYGDVLNNRVNSYYVNPVGTSCSSIISITTAIANITGIDVAAPSILAAASNLATCTYNFYKHTQRLSGLEGINAESGDKPTLQLAINIGRQLSYYLYQTESIDDNSVILGSFSSLYTKSNLTSYITTISSYPTIIQSGITSNPDIVPPTYTYTGPTTEIVDNLNNIADFVNGKRTSDEAYYFRSRQIVANFGKAAALTSNGSAHKQLVNEVIGTNYAKERVNKS
jgi:hypothetical protein